MRGRRPILLRWVRVPFADLALLLALVSAAFAPSFLVAAAAHWERSAGDAATARLVTGADDDSSLDQAITVDALFASPDVLSTADDRVRDVVADPRLGHAVRTMSTPRALALRPDDLSPVGVPVRMLAHPDALGTLDVLDGEPGATGGVWISEWFATRFGFSIGDSLVLESSLQPDDPGAEAAPGGGPTIELPVVGVYATVWSIAPGELAPLWEALGETGIVPAFIGPFNEPNFSLIVTDEATLARSGISGSVRWDVPLVAPPATFDGLESLASRMAAIERSLGSDPAVVAALDALSPGATRLEVQSEIPEVLAEARSAVRLLGQPLTSAQAAAIAMGVTIMASAGVFIVRRRATEYRLLAGEGERWWRIGPRTAAQLVAPTLIGASLGLLAAAVAARIAFDGAAIDPWGIDWLVFGLVLVGGVAAAALASGLSAQATLDTGRLGVGGSARWPLVVAGGVLWYLWTQVGRSVTRGAGAIDLTVVALPLAALVTAVLALIALLDILSQSVRRAARPDRVGAVLFLALRRTTTARVGGRIAIGALGVGAGLLVFSWILTATLTHAVDVKSAVAVGGASSVELLSHPDPDVSLPPATTLVAVQDTRVSPGALAVRVVAVDPETFASGVVWSDDYGLDVEQVLDLLTHDVGFGVPVVGIAGQGTPATGSFGTFQSFPFQIVGHADAVPFAAPAGLTLLVSAREIERFDDGRPEVANPNADLPGVSSPVRRYRPYLVTTGSLASIEPFLADQGLVVRDIVSRREVIESVDAVAARTAFEYLTLLGGVGALSSVAAIALYLSMRRRSAALSGVLARRMGLGAGKSALVTTTEVGLLATLAVASGAAVGPALARRLLPRFDPVQNLPPALDVVVPVGVAMTAAGVVFGVLLIVWIAERAAAGRSPAEVLRDVR